PRRLKNTLIVLEWVGDEDEKFETAIIDADKSEAKIEDVLIGRLIGLVKKKLFFLFSMLNISDSGSLSTAELIMISRLIGALPPPKYRTADLSVDSLIDLSDSNADLIDISVSLERKIEKEALDEVTRVCANLQLPLKY